MKTAEEWDDELAALNMTYRQPARAWRLKVIQDIQDDVIASLTAKVLEVVERQNRTAANAAWAEIANEAGVGTPEWADRMKLLAQKLSSK